MTAQFTPGPWLLSHHINGDVRVYRWVGNRKESLTDAAGSYYVFRSEESAHAAIAKATGSAA